MKSLRTATARLIVIFAAGWGAAGIAAAAGSPCDTCETPPAIIPWPRSFDEGHSTDAPNEGTLPAPAPTPANSDTDDQSAPPTPSVTPLAPDQTLGLNDATGSSNQPPVSSVASSSSSQANFAPNMIGDFFRGNGTSVGVFAGAVGEFVVGDELAESGLFAPSGPFNIASIVDPVGPAYVYRNAPAPFGELLVVDQRDLNGDLIDDFVLTADPSKTTTSGLSSAVSYAGLSNGVVTPSMHDLYDLVEYYVITVPNPAAGDRVGRARIQDNNSARPQDRVYFDYNYFHNAAIVSGGADVSRYTVGFEKTFFNGVASLDVRLPMASTVSSEITADSGIDFNRYEFGNILLAPKVVLASTCNWIWSAGLGVALPTADATTVALEDGTELLRVRNDSVHLVPYLTASYQPVCSPWFAHAFLTLDVDAGGNRVDANLEGTGLEGIGRYNDQTLLSLDLAVGSWVYESCGSGATIDRLGWSAELHYTASVNDADYIQRDAFFIGDPADDLSVLNSTLGGHARIGMTTITAAYSVPLNGDERVFDGEFRCFVNRNF